MQVSTDFAKPGMKIHARTPAVILLVGDVKKLVQLVRTAVERKQHSYSDPNHEHLDASSRSTHS